MFCGRWLYASVTRLIVICLTVVCVMQTRIKAQGPIIIGRKPEQSQEPKISFGYKPVFSQPTSSKAAIQDPSGKIVFLQSGQDFNEGHAALNAAFYEAGAGKIIIGTRAVSYTPLSDKTFQLYKTAITSFAKIYTSRNLTIDAGDSSNYAVGAVKNLFETIFDNMRVLGTTIVNNASLGKPFNDYIKKTLLTQVMPRYLAAVSDMGLGSIIQKNYETVLFAPFKSQFYSMILDILTFALKHLATFGPDIITDENYNDAIIYYDAARKLWDETKDPKMPLTIDVPGYQSPQDVFIGFHATFAQIAQHYFSKQMLSMKPESQVSAFADIMGAENANSIRLSKAIDAACRAATAYSDGKIDDPGFAGQCANLTAALKSFDTVRAQSTVTEQAAQAGATKSLLFAGGALWLGHHVDRVTQLLLGADNGKQGQTILDTFVNNNKAKVTALNAILPTLDVAYTDNGADIFQALADACRKKDSTTLQAWDYYDRAASNYLVATQDVPAQSVLLTQEQLSYARASKDLYQQAAVLLDQTADVAHALSTALQTLKTSQRLADINSAQTTIDQALKVAHLMDESYQKISSVHQARTTAIIPFYGLFTDNSFVRFIVQHVVHYYRVKASSIAQNKTVEGQRLYAQYVMFAAFYVFNYKQYVHENIARDITQLLNATSKQITALAAQSLAAATAADKQYRASSAVGQTLLAVWDTALSCAFTAYILWRTAKGDVAKVLKDAPGLYGLVLNAYVQSYALSVQLDSTPRQILLYYRFYLLTIVGALTTGVTPISVKNQIKTLLSNFWNTANTLKSTISHEASSQDDFKKILEALEKLINWQKNANILVEESNSLFEDQKNITPSKLTPPDMLTERQEARYRVVIVPDIPDVVLDNLQLKQAQTYEQYGDWAARKHEEDTSRTSAISDKCAIEWNLSAIAAYEYGRAKIAYSQLGDAYKSKVETLIAQESLQRIISQADMAGNAVKTVGTDSITFGHFLGTNPVFARYFASPVLMPLPQSQGIFLTPATLPTTLADYQKDLNNNEKRARVLRDLKDTAAALYLFQRVQALGRLDDFTAKYDFLAVIQSSDADGGVTDPAFIPVTRDARDYRIQLNIWIDKGLQSQSGFIKTMLNFIAPAGRVPVLVYCNLPVLPVPVSRENALDPTAIILYMNALQQYRAAQNISNSVKNYVAKKIEAYEHRVQYTYLSQAYALYQKARFIDGAKLDDWLLDLIIIDSEERKALVSARDNLISVRKKTDSIGTLDNGDDPNAKILLDAITLMNNYLNVAMDFAHTVHRGAQQPVAIAGLKSAAGIMGFVLEYQGDIISQAMVGDPHADTYKTFFDQAMQKYQIALGAYEQGEFKADRARVLVKLANHFQKVGNRFVHDRDYIRALRYFNSAARMYQDASNAYGTAGDSSKQTENSSQAKKMGVMSVRSLINAGTDLFLHWYGVWRSSPILLPSGAQIASYEQLVLEHGKLAESSEQRNLYDSIKKDYLHAMLYYMSLNTLIGQFPREWNIRVAMAPTSPNTNPKGVTVSPPFKPIIENPEVVAYLKSHVTGDSLAAYIMKKSATPDQLRDIFVGFADNALGGFSSAQTLESAAISKAFANVIAWVNKVYAAITIIYIRAFMGVNCAGMSEADCIKTSSADLMTQLRAEAQNVASPSQQYFR